MSTKPLLTIGITGTATKENEYRLAIHPDDLQHLPKEIKEKLYVEEGYGFEKFGTTREYLDQHTAGVLPRAELFKKCDMVVLPKPTESDFEFFGEGQVIFGWPHCVQGPTITQEAVDKRMTLIAWEAMFDWSEDGKKGRHTFHTNNNLAGFASVDHALTLKGITEHYGQRSRSAAVIGHGATGQGAIKALQAKGIQNITVYTQRPPEAVADKIDGVEYKQVKRQPMQEGKGDLAYADAHGEDVLFAEVLAGHEIIVNCTLQNPNNPLMYIRDYRELSPGTLIVDVSCDEAMGFTFAKPTSFEEPTYEVGNGITFYAVDHSPSHFYNTATDEISTAVVPLLPELMAGPDTWQKNPTIVNAIEIKGGVIQNEEILKFQNRESEYPHNYAAGNISLLKEFSLK